VTARRDADRAYQRAYYAANRSKILGVIRTKRNTDPSAQKAWNDKWLAAHPGYGREAAQRRRARLAGVPCTLTAAEWRAIVEHFNGACAYCLRTDRPLTQEHVVAIAAGGAHTADNVVPACQSCNSRKHDRGILKMLPRAA
jgi:5-methylcytosine-specific restriction endonuclease McrA